MSTDVTVLRGCGSTTVVNKKINGILDRAYTLTKPKKGPRQVTRNGFLVLHMVYIHKTAVTNA